MKQSFVLIFCTLEIYNDLMPPVKSNSTLYQSITIVVQMYYHCSSIFITLYTTNIIPILNQIPTPIQL